MTDGDPEIRPWPAWVRRPLIALLLVIVGYGLVAFVRAGLPASTWRVVIAVVALPALLGPLVRLGRARRLQAAPSRSTPTGRDLADVYHQAWFLSGRLREAGRHAAADRFDAALHGTTGNEACVLLAAECRVVLTHERHLPEDIRADVDRLWDAVGGVAGLPDR